MATELQITQLRRLINDTTEPYTFSNEELSTAIDAAEGDLDSVAGAMWEQKAATFSTMVNVSESGSSRSMGDLYKNALEQAKYFRGKASTPTAEAQRTRIGRIVRG